MGAAGMRPRFDQIRPKSDSNPTQIRTKPVSERTEPRHEPIQGLFNLRRGESEGEAHEAVAVDGIEIHAGGGGDAGVFQELQEQARQEAEEDGTEGEEV